MTVTGQRSFRHFYLAIFLLNFYLLGLAFIVWCLRNEALSEIGYFIMILMAAILVFAAIYTAFRYYRNVPLISVDEESISLGNSIFYWKDLENIEMTGKRPFKFMWEQKEGMLLKFQGQKEMYIFDDLYENISEIKSFVETVAVDRVVPNEPIPDSPPVRGEEPHLEKARYYKGFPLYSFEGIMLWGMIAFFLHYSGYGFSKAQSNFFLNNVSDTVSFGVHSIRKTCALFWAIKWCPCYKEL
jgi:hypothetical protein